MILQSPSFLPGVPQRFNPSTGGRLRGVCAVGLGSRFVRFGGWVPRFSGGFGGWVASLWWFWWFRFFGDVGLLDFGGSAGLVPFLMILL